MDHRSLRASAVGSTVFWVQLFYTALVPPETDILGWANVDVA